MAEEICEKCGREIPNHQQAYVVGGKIVCAECDRVLRSEQVPQPALSPGPLPETRKDTKKDASLRNCVLAAIGIIIVAVVLWNIFFSAPKYQVEEEVDGDGLKVMITGSPDNLDVVLVGPFGTYSSITVKKIVFYKEGGNTIADTYIPFCYLGPKGHPCSFENNVTKKGEYELRIQKSGSERIVFSKKMEIIGGYNSNSVEIVKPDRVKRKDGLSYEKF